MCAQSTEHIQVHHNNIVYCSSLNAREATPFARRRAAQHFWESIHSNSNAPKERDHRIAPSHISSSARATPSTIAQHFVDAATTHLVSVAVCIASHLFVFVVCVVRRVCSGRESVRFLPCFFFVASISRVKLIRW